MSKSFISIVDVESKFQASSNPLTTVRSAIQKSHLNRPTNFKLLKKRNVRNRRPKNVSIQETVRIATAFPAILTAIFSTQGLEDRS